MSNASAELARSITRISSTQSYTIACLLADKDLRDDCLRAYAYFRWADDVIDVAATATAERIAFIERQKEVVDACYRQERPTDLTSEEELIADLIANERGENSGLQSFIRNFIAVLDFDARRKGQFICQTDLIWYSHCLGKAVTDAVQYFIGNDHLYPDGPDRYLAATAAHITHMLRDMADDIKAGFVNIPQEWLAIHNFTAEGQDIGQLDLNAPAVRAWVRSQVELARDYFVRGKRYLDGLDPLRCRIAGHWYCARFECVLDAIEKDGYLLRCEYCERRKLRFKFKLVWLALAQTVRSPGHRGRCYAAETADHASIETSLEEQFGRPVAARSD